MDNRRAPLIAGLAVAGVAILMVLLLVLPKMGQVSQAQVQLDQARGEQQTLESRKSALEDAKAAAPEARKTIAEVHKRIPPTAHEPVRILLLQIAARGDRYQHEPRARRDGGDGRASADADRDGPDLHERHERGTRLGARSDLGGYRLAMPISDRDKRTLKIGGIVAGVLIVGLVLFHVPSGGGGTETALPPSPPRSPTPPVPPTVAPTTTPTPFALFTGRDPFSTPPQFL